MPHHKTSAWPLAMVYAGLIVYASLYPFAYWRDQGVSAWMFWLAPWPKYWTAFDVVANVLGYMPLGFLLALSALRIGRGQVALANAVAATACLSFCMESLQVFLPDRVPSNLDLLLNISGGVLGAVMAWMLERLGVLQRWERFRAQWFVEESRGALVLLALWPLALLFPTAVPFGLGQVLQRLESAARTLLADSPMQAWLRMEQVGMQPPSGAVEWLCMVSGLLIPGLLGYCVIERWRKRAWFLFWMAAFGVAATGLSAALSFGPEHAWVWFGPSVRAAVLFAVALLALVLWLPLRMGAVLAVLVLGVNLSLLNQSATNPYFEQTLFLWEQGRFIRFHGLAQWLGWLWPFAVLVYVLSLAARRTSKN
ncbi:MAG: VanZ family protein [Rhodoferax sp.]|uniref:VanZ family protein n=1 Tax=Rhodoferax sp. TaxID=50421 RepID=UPI001B4C1BDF|nr:VanZ family protein [Rhodoferax sp.]MBP9907443.1 VanZ family protein [Rhodoferax sp.]